MLLSAPGGGGREPNTRCTGHSFRSREELFRNATNFLVTPGNNDWSDCRGYNATRDTDPIRELWRRHFVAGSSSFHSFGQDFPGGGRPTLHRQESRPENYFFVRSEVAFFGISQPESPSHTVDAAATEANERWVEEHLSADRTACTFRSIVLLSHTPPHESLYDTIDEYFEACGAVLPILSVSGGARPRTYCMSHDVAKARVHVTVEAFEAGPLLISVVRDPQGGGDFFHVEDTDPNDSNRQCPSFSEVKYRTYRFI